MSNSRFYPAVIISFLIIFFTTDFGLRAQDTTGKVDLTSRPDPEGTPTQVTVSINVLDIDAISGAKQTFSSNFAVAAIWKDSRLAGGSSTRTVSLTNIWHPSIQIVNQQRVLTTFKDVARISPDGTVKWVQRYWGQLANPLNLRDFPFDHHTFAIRLVAAVGSSDAVELSFSEEDGLKSGLAETLSLPDWDITSSKVFSGPLALIKGAKPLPGATFEFEATRHIGYYVIKVLLPLLMIVMMSWIVFWIHPSESGSQISVSITSMLTLIAYRFALGSMLPAVSYLTRMDGFILFSTILVFVALMQAVFTSRLVKLGKEDTALKIDQICRVLFPAIFVAVCAMSIWL